jgi:hypothetical protein
MKIFVTTGDWKIEESAKPETINAPTQTKKNDKTVIEMAHCPRFDHCCAPICPIDTDWRKRAHRKDEPVCAYLRRYAKDPLWGQKQGVVPTELWSRIGEVYPQVIERYAPLKKSLNRASVSPFRSVGKREGQ